MTAEHVEEEQQIVTCDDCGNPYAAIVDREGLVLVGGVDAGCPNCDGREFTRLVL